MLNVRDLTIHYGGIVAVRNVSVDVNEGEMVAIIGRNGAGKSTLLNGMSGIVKTRGGHIEFKGSRIEGMKPYQVARRGVIQVPEGRRILSPLSVEENLELGRHAANDRFDRTGDDLDKVYAIFPILAERRRQAAGSLSGGQQQMLAIGRALMGRPVVLLLDEPSLGLDPIMTDQVFRALKLLNEGGLAILLVEQNARRALDVTSRAYVMEQGRVVQHGSSETIARDPKINEHYLGAALGS